MATYTRRDLVTLTLSRLFREASDDTIPATLLHGAIDRARKAEWRAAGGPEPETVRLSLVANRREYPVPGPVAAVSVRDGAGVGLRRLVRLTPKEFLERYPSYPDAPDTSGEPVVYVVRPAGSTDPSLSMLYRVLTRSAPATAYSPAVSLWPAPATSLVDGLAVESESEAAELPDDDTLSALPEPVDDAACWAAALDLLPYIGEEANARNIEPMLSRRLQEARLRARQWMADMWGGGWTFAPRDHFGTKSTLRRSAGAPLASATPPASTPAQPRRVGTSASALSANGSETATRIDTSSQPVVSGSAILAFSGERLFIEPSLVTVGAGGLYVDVAPPPGADGGTPRWYGERVYVFYDTEVAG